MRQVAPEDPRLFPESGGGEGARPSIRRGARAQAVQTGGKTSRWEVRSGLHGFGGPAEMKEAWPPSILRIQQAIGQTPVRDAEKRRFAYRTMANAGSRRAELESKEC